MLDGIKTVNIIYFPIRYGWIDNQSIAILRHMSHENCAKNMTGFIINSKVSPEETYDVYCYDEKGAFHIIEWTLVFDSCMKF